MRKILFLITLTSLLYTCGSSQSKPAILDGCMDDKHSQFVASISSQFDSIVNDRYTSDPYKSYIAELSSMSIPPEVFVESELLSFLKNKESSAEFQDIWIKEDGMYSLNLEGSYFSCLKEKSDDETLRAILVDLEKAGMSISPALISKALQSELTDEQYQSEYIRTYIAVNLYSEFAINIYDRFEK